MVRAGTAGVERSWWRHSNGQQRMGKIHSGQSREGAGWASDRHGQSSHGRHVVLVCLLNPKNFLSSSCQTSSSCTGIRWFSRHCSHWGPRSYGIFPCVNWHHMATQQGSHQSSSHVPAEEATFPLLILLGFQFQERECLRS